MVLNNCAGCDSFRGLARVVLVIPLKPTSSCTTHNPQSTCESHNRLVRLQKGIFLWRHASSVSGGLLTLLQVHALPRAGAPRGADSSDHHYRRTPLLEQGPLMPLTIKHLVTIISLRIVMHLNRNLIMRRTTRKSMKIWSKLLWQLTDSRKAPLAVHTMLRAMKRYIAFRT